MTNLLRRLAATLGALILGAAVIAGGVAVADNHDPRVPGLCYVYSGGGWLGAPCTDGLEPYFPEDSQPVTRYAGNDRYSTAAQFSAGEFAPGVASVYVSNGQSLVDALAAGAATDGPVLLVPATGTLPQSVADELARLNPGRIVVLGSETSVSADMLTQVRAAALR